MDITNKDINHIGHTTLIQENMGCYTIINEGEVIWENKTGFISGLIHCL